jgi:hypothetical protein
MDFFPFDAEMAIYDPADATDARTAADAVCMAVEADAEWQDNAAADDLAAYRMYGVC